MFVLQIDEKLPAWKCEECGVATDKLYDADPWLFCIDCKQAELRRKQLVESEKEFNSLGGQDE